MRVSPQLVLSIILGIANVSRNVVLSICLQQATATPGPVNGPSHQFASDLLAPLIVNRDRKIGLPSPLLAIIDQL